jgi:Rrf2 family iron-sulfur cluster assembly transcriptional regulator
MLDLALNAHDNPVSLADISQRQDISLSYLEQLFAKLRRSNLVTSVRGPGGGYLLSRSTQAIYVAQIIDAVNESIDATGCNGAADCQDGETCLTHYLWSDLSAQIHAFLSGISLSSLVERREVQVVSVRQHIRERGRQSARESRRPSEASSILCAVIE